MSKLPSVKVLFQSQPLIFLPFCLDPMAPLLLNVADGDVAAEEAIDEALHAEDNHLFGSADEMYEAARGRGWGERLLLPDLVANAADDSDSNSGSSSDYGDLTFVRSRFTFRAILERVRGRDWRDHVGFPADRGNFSSSFPVLWSTLCCRGE